MEPNARTERILVVDDHGDNREILTRRLARLGFAVETVTSGREALSAISTDPPHLVLLDYMMPEMTGLAVLGELRKEYGQSILPIIMLTARSDEESVVECLRAGANDFVSKPVAFPILRARIDAQLERCRSVAALNQLNAELERKVAERTNKLAEHNEALALAFREVDDANNAKSLFLAGISHELRTPLNAIIGLSELLRKQVLGPLEPARYVDLATEIHRNGHYLLDIVSAVLETTRFERGTADLAAEPVDLRGVVDEAVTMLQNVACEPATRLSWTTFPAATIVGGDHSKLKQVLTNILSNAFRFTPPERPVAMTCRMDADYARIEVADEGPGIPEAQIQEALKPFVQIYGATNVKHGGVGLGLHIANQIVKCHGGRLQLRNRTPTGLSVEITLPIDPTPPAVPGHT